MTSSYDTIKTRLKTILQSERTIKFLDELTNFSLSLSNATQINNKFIKEVFQGKGIEIENKYNRKRYINNIIIDNKKILVRFSSITSKVFNFKYGKEDQIDFSIFKERINNELDNIDYFFIIRIFDKLKVCYHYYLFPSEYFKIKENFPVLSKYSFSGQRWIFRNYREFCFKYDIGSLILFNICPPYISQ